MMVESFFVLLCKSLDFARHNVHFQVSVEVSVPNVPGCIDNVPKNFVLESLYNVYITLCGATPELDTVCPTGFSICLYRSCLLWRDSEEFLPISQYIFLYPRPSSFRFFLTWAWSCRWNKKALSPEDLQMICHAIYNIKIDQNNFLHTTFLIHRAHPLSYPNYTAYWKQKMLQWARKQKCWIRPRSCQMWYRISR